MSNSEYDLTGSLSGTEEEPNSDSSADYSANTRSSLRSFSIQNMRDTSDLSISTMEDGRSSYIQDEPDKRRKRSHLPGDQIYDANVRHPTYMNEYANDSQVTLPKIKKHPSFRDIKICPSQAQVTHKIFNVDEEDFIT